MLEWYRRGWSMDGLMDEVDALLRALLPAPLPPAERCSYRDALLQHAGCDPLADNDARLAECAESLGVEPALLRSLDRDGLLDLLMGAHVGPRLGQEGPCFVHRYPASQAALARLDPPTGAWRCASSCTWGAWNSPTASRNWAMHVNSAPASGGPGAARCTRLAAARIGRTAAGGAGMGLPACSGVALGFDRLVMHACGAGRIEDVLAFLPGEA